MVSFEDIRCFYMDKSWMLDRIDQFEWDLSMMEGQTPYAAIQYIRKHIGYDDYLKEYARERRISEEDLFTVLTEIQEKRKIIQICRNGWIILNDIRPHFWDRRADIRKK